MFISTNLEHVGQIVATLTEITVIVSLFLCVAIIIGFFRLRGIARDVVEKTVSKEFKAAISKVDMDLKAMVTVARHNNSANSDPNVHSGGEESHD